MLLCFRDTGFATRTRSRRGSTNKVLLRNHPDRIQISFDNHRLVTNAGLLPPATLARHLGLRELVDHHHEPGGAPGGGLHPGRHGQGAVHPAARLPVGPCLPTGPVEPRASGLGLSGWRQTRRRGPDSTICETCGLAKEGAPPRPAPYLIRGL